MSVPWCCARRGGYTGEGKCRPAEMLGSMAAEVFECSSRVSYLKLRTRAKNPVAYGGNAPL